MRTSYGVGQYSGSGPTEAHQWGVSHGYKADGTKRLIVWCHSAGGLAPEPFIGAGMPAILGTTIENLGLPFISFDGSPPSGGVAQHWGNDTSQSRLNDAVSFAGSVLGTKTDKILLMGVSMGGLLALNWARANPTKVAALALFYPCVNLQAMHDGTGGAASASASVDAAYGGTDGSFETACPTHDPAQNESAYSSASYPMLMWYSTADTTVGTANQTTFAAAVGSALQVQSLGAVSHADMTQPNAAQVQSFTAAHA